ncbi:AAA family ATPase [Nocardia sp. NPDC056100]|uniref:helix-turn-helix transcriptional regulator n=1 Tax=Nocardia sp. NPDC056100 TaxID=3345712 RepID=UPI0035DACB32
MVNLPVSSALIGRGGELSALLDAVGGATHAVLIAGEAGIGKSRLIGEFTRRLDRGTLVLSGRCPEFGSDGVAFAPFLAVMRRLLRELGVAEMAALLPPQPALANWLPRLAVHTGTAAPEPDRIRLFGEILTVIEQLAMTRQTVLILEDLHWADAASRELLTFLVANLADGDVLLIGSYRPGDSGPLRELIAELRRDPGVRTLDLAPLTRHEVGRQLAALLAREPEPALITMVFERSGGNPLFVEALGQAPDQIPADLADLLLGFQRGLTPPAHALLRIAAAIGSPIRHDLLAEAVDLPSDALHAALRELVTRQLLLTTDTGYEFRHILIRQAVYNDLLPGERTQLHSRLADVLRANTSHSGNAAELAHHAAAAGDFTVALGAYWSAATGTSESVSGPERFAYLEQVVALRDRVSNPDELLGVSKLAVLEQLTECAVASGAIDRGIAAATAALDLIDPSADPVRAAHLHLRRAFLRGSTGAGPGDDLTRALSLLPSTPSTLEHGEALAQFALTTVFAGDPDAAAPAADTALSLAESLSAPALVARSHAYLGLIAVGSTAADSSHEAALRHFESARAAARAAGDPLVLLDVVTWESAVLLAAGEYRAAISTVRVGLRAAQQSFRFAESAPILLVKWVQALTALGSWAEARAVVDEAEFERLPPLSRAALLVSYGKIALGQGDTDAARSYAGQAGELLGDGRWAIPYRLQRQLLIGSIAIQVGDWVGVDSALAEVWSLGDVIAILEAHPHDAWPVLALAARRRVAHSEIEGARSEVVVEGMLALGDSLSCTSPVDIAHRGVFRAWRAGTAAGWDLAVRAWRGLEQPFEEAESLLELAELLAVQGDREAAAGALGRVVELAGGLSAEPLIAAAGRVATRARISIDGSGGDSPKVRESGGSRTFGLTARELEVLRLVAKGLSNRGVAGELFISANTAGVHVSRILTKLGVASRTEAAAFAHEHGLLG